MPHVERYIDGVWFPSVTTIMGASPKPWLRAWQDKWGILAVRKAKIAGAIGTEFHRCIESFLETGTYEVVSPTLDGFTMPSTVARVKGMMKSWTKWAASVDGRIDYTEMKVVSLAHIYSGTLDAVGTLDGKPAIYDWKTSARIYGDMQLQLAAYAHAYNEQCNGSEKRLPVKYGIIVCVSKDKPHFKVTTKEFKLGKRVFGRFLKLRAMFDDVKAPPDEAAV